MTTPKYATRDGGLRRYAHPTKPDEPLLSVTSVLQSLGKPALIGWAAKITAEHAINNLPRLVNATRTPDGRADALRELKSARTAAGTKATEHGSAVHDAAERYVLQNLHPTDPDLAGYVDAYVAWLTEWQVDLNEHIHATETTVANRQHSYAGTADLEVYLPLNPPVDGYPATPTTDGKRHLWLVDFKSSQGKPPTTIYVDHALQLAAYVHAEEQWLPNGTIARHVKPVGAAILNLRDGGRYGFLPIPRLRDAYDAFTHLAAVARYTDAWEAPPVITAAGEKPKRTRRTTKPKTTTTPGEAA